MTLFRFVPLLLALLLGACAFIAPIQPASTFYVMRHLHTPEGTADPDLTSEGQRHAELLANWFGDNPPAAIFVSNTKRAQQTAAPLAARLGLTPRIYDPHDTRFLVTEIMKEPPPVLIVGHSNTVPDIVQALSGRRTEALTHEDFGDIWMIRGDRRGFVKRRLAE
jgi:broad specificity phosphatase PhoE